jgi:hypothetical protein
MKCYMLSLLDSLDLGEKMLAAQEFTWLSSLKLENHVYVSNELATKFW